MTRVGNRVPRDYFITRGSGQSDITVHAGSYHLALRQAGIEMANIMTYSSIMPAIAIESPKPAITHGEVMESIMAVAHAERGARATAGIIFGWLIKDDGSRHGGLVCEYNGDLHPDDVRPHLLDMLTELYTNGYEQFDLQGIEFHVQSTVAEKKHATALVAICFTSFEVPTDV